MIVETTNGKYELIKNYKDGFDKTMFEAKYIEEVYDKYTYILGDMSGGILRIKGFSSDPKSKNSYFIIPDYLVESCAFECAYFVLKRIKEKQIEEKQIEEKGNEE